MIIRVVALFMCLFSAASFRTKGKIYNLGKARIHFVCAEFPLRVIGSIGTDAVYYSCG